MVERTLLRRLVRENISEDKREGVVLPVGAPRVSKSHFFVQVRAVATRKLSFVQSDVRGKAHPGHTL